MRRSAVTHPLCNGEQPEARLWSVGLKMGYCLCRPSKLSFKYNVKFWCGSDMIKYVTYRVQ